jgi:hypothetical protein
MVFGSWELDCRIRSRFIVVDVPRCDAPTHVYLTDWMVLNGKVSAEGIKHRLTFLSNVHILYKSQIPFSFARIYHVRSERAI